MKKIVKFKHIIVEQDVIWGLDEDGRVWLYDKLRMTWKKLPSPIEEPEE